MVSHHLIVRKDTEPASLEDGDVIRLGGTELEDLPQDG